MESTELAESRLVAGKQTTVLPHYGRKVREAPQSHDLVRSYIGTANVNHQWVPNVQKTPQVTLSIGAKDFQGTARFLTQGSEHEGAMAAIRRKYWMFRPILEFGRLLAAIGVMRDRTGSFEVIPAV